MPRPANRPGCCQGAWTALCDRVAAEISALGAGRLPHGNEIPPSVAVLLFSTSEKEWSRGRAPGLDMRRALESQGLRVYNPRNKTAGRPGSPVHSLAALVSYLIDPVTLAAAGTRGREVMVWASCGDQPGRPSRSRPRRPSRIAAAHATIQKEYRGSTAGIRAPGPPLQVCSVTSTRSALTWPMPPRRTWRAGEASPGLPSAAWSPAC